MSIASEPCIGEQQEKLTPKILQIQFIKSFLEVVAKGLKKRLDDPTLGNLGVKTDVRTCNVLED